MLSKMKDSTKKYSFGVAVMVLLLGLVAVLLSTTGRNPMQTLPEDELLGSADEQIVDDVGPPPQLMVDPEVSLSGALTPDGNFYRYERSGAVPAESRLTKNSPRENWVPIVSDKQYDSILKMLDANTNVTDQLTLAVVWNAKEQEWDVYPNKIFRSSYGISTLDIFSTEFDGVVLFNANRAFRYADHVEDRVGDFEVKRGWNYGPKPKFSDIRGQVVTFWSGDVTGNATMLTPRADLGKAVSQSFVNGLDDDKTYWFYVRGVATSSCSNVEQFVCGRDGNTYQNSCKAGEEGVTVNYEGKCKNDRTALVPKIKETTLASNGVLVLEFFNSATDTTARDIQIAVSEIDLNRAGENLAIYRKNGANRDFITSFVRNDVATGTKDIRISLNNKLVAGDYELRVFDTFEKEKVVRSELEFKVQEDRQVVQVTYRIETLTANSVTLTPTINNPPSSIRFEDVREKLALYDAASNTKIQGTRVEFDDTTKKLTLNFPVVPANFLTVDSPNYKLKLEETTKADEFWKINAFERELKAVKIVDDGAFLTDSSITPDFIKSTRFRFSNDDFLTGDFQAVKDLISLYIKEQPTSPFVKINSVVSNLILRDNSPVQQFTIVFQSYDQFKVSVDQFSYIDSFGYYLPIQEYIYNNPEKE